MLVAPGTGGPRVVALNRAARAVGIKLGDLVSSARAKAVDLQTRDADPAADDAGLRRLALWCVRYTPFAAPWREDDASGVFLDSSGCAHLFGGEARMLDLIEHGLRRLGMHPRVAIADTAGAAWGVAHYGPAGFHIVAAGAQAAALRGLPAAALRLPGETRALLHRLGLRRVGDVMDQPRGPFTARFGAGLLLRLDQALGTAPEPISPLVAPPVYHARAGFLDALTAAEHVVEAARQLLDTVAEELARDRVGARKVRLLLFRLDGEVLTVTFGLARPSRDAAHMARLIALRLERQPEGLEADFGFEAIAVHVLAVAPMPEQQTLLGLSEEPLAETGFAQLIDRLEQRLGEHAVRRLHPRQSHVPERAVTAKAVGDAAPDWGDTNGRARPLLLLPYPELAEVMALVPEGPPQQFRWRGMLHQVTGAEGPERIAPEWWRNPGAEMEAERDYYVLETGQGQRFWLYRAGHYGAGPLPNWFVHGVFA